MHMLCWLQYFWLWFWFSDVWWNDCWRAFTGFRSWCKKYS